MLPRVNAHVLGLLPTPQPRPTTHFLFTFQSAKNEVTFSNTWNSFSTICLEHSRLQAPGWVPGIKWDS